jgi:hypothetical protein
MVGDALEFPNDTFFGSTELSLCPYSNISLEIASKRKRPAGHRTNASPRDAFCHLFLERCEIPFELIDRAFFHRELKITDP